MPNSFVVVAVVAVVLARRLSWSELKNSDTDVWRGPLVITAAGIYQLYDRHLHVGVLDIVLLVVGTAVALVAGAASGRVAQVERRAGKVFFRLGPPGLGIMVAFVVVRLGLAGLGQLVGASTSGGGSLMVAVGANLLTQSLIIQSKAQRETEEISTR